jgi:hypothetical protein
MRIPFAVGAYQSRSLPLSRQRLVNAQLLNTPAEQKSQAPVIRTPGIKAWVTVGTQIRGAILCGDVLVVVSGTSAYRVTSAGAATSVGTIPGADPVRMATNGTDTVVLTNGVGYVVSASAVTVISDTDFVAATDVVWVDGYFVFLGSDRVFTSEFGDPQSYDALAYDWPQGSPSDVLSLMVEKRDLIHFKADSIEVWYNKGSTPYPFGRAPDGFIELGCAARYSPAKLDNSVFWLASDRTVRVLRGATPQRISTEIIEQALQSYATIDDAFGMSLSHDGRFSYVLTFPTEGATWEYNLATQQWNERESFNRGRWRPDGALAAFGKILVWADNLIGELDPFTYAEWGDPLIVTMTSTPIVDGPSQVFHSRLEVQCEAGIGLLAGQGSNPQLMLRYSDDSQNWSPQFWRTLGQQGDYKRRAVWTRLGRSRGRVYELAYSEPTPFTFYGAYLNEEQAIAA